MMKSQIHSTNFWIFFSKATVIPNCFCSEQGFFFSKGKKSGSVKHGSKGSKPGGKRRPTDKPKFHPVLRIWLDWLSLAPTSPPVPVSHQCVGLAQCEEIFNCLCNHYSWCCDFQCAQLLPQKRTWPEEVSNSLCPSQFALVPPALYSEPTGFLNGLLSLLFPLFHPFFPFNFHPPSLP